MIWIYNGDDDDDDDNCNEENVNKDINYLFIRLNEGWMHFIFFLGGGILFWAVGKKGLHVWYWWSWRWQQQWPDAFGLRLEQHTQMTLEKLR